MNHRTATVKVAGVSLLAFAVAIGLAVVPAEASHVIKIGGTCDRTGETKVIGIDVCPGVADYIALVNRKGGVLGHTWAKFRRTKGAIKLHCLLAPTACSPCVPASSVQVAAIA